MAAANYYLADDYGVAAGATVNGPGGGGSGEILVGPFSALTIANAYTVAHLCASALQRPIRLVPVGAPPPYTLVIGVGPNVSLTQVPSGITY